MLIIYDKTTGEVVDNSGTSSVWPEGPPDELAWINTDNAGKDRSSLKLLRLHDVNDIQTINKLTGKLYHINPNTEKIVIDGAIPEPEPVPSPPTVEERLTALADLLVAKGTVDREEIDIIEEPKVREE